jgi:hypothetical protein
MPALEPRLDWRVLGFTLALSLLTGIIFGLAPAWRTTKVDLTPSLKDGLRASTSIHRSFLSRGLVVVQVALSLLLLVGAGLFVRTLLNLQRVDPGFNTQNLLLFGVEPGLIGYKEEKLRQRYSPSVQARAVFFCVKLYRRRRTPKVASSPAETDIVTRCVKTFWKRWAFRCSRVARLDHRTPPAHREL